MRKIRLIKTNRRKRKENNMEDHIKEIEQIALRYTESPSDGYSQIMKICNIM